MVSDQLPLQCRVRWYEAPGAVASSWFETSRDTGEGEGVVILFMPLVVDCILSDSTDTSVNLLVLLSTHVLSFFVFSVRGKCCRSVDTDNAFVLVFRLLVVVDVEADWRYALMLFCTAIRFWQI
jgi:hypothetical protein